MADQTVSKEEMNALLDAGEADKAKPRREKQVAEYDFAHPSRLSGEQIKALRRLHEGVAIRLATDLTTVLRAPIKVDFSGVTEQSFAGLRSALPEPTAISVLAMPPLTERSLLTIDMKLAYGLIDRMLGGPGKAPAKLRPLTALEQGLLDNIIRHLLDRIGGGWKDLVPFTPAVESMTTDPQSIEVIPRAEPLLVFSFTVAGPEGFDGGECCFSLPYVAVEAALAKLGRPVKFAATKHVQTADQRKQIDQVLGKATLHLEVRLGTTTISIGELLSIKAGDVLVLDQGPKDLIEARLAGRVRALGHPGRVGKSIAFLVEKTMSAPAGAAGKPAKT